MRHFSLVRKPIKVVHLIWWKNSLVAKSVKTNCNRKPLVYKLNGAEVNNLCRNQMVQGTWVLYMSFDKFLLAVESRDLSQAHKSNMCLLSQNCVMGSRTLNYTKKNYLALGNLAKLMFWSILSFKNLQDWNVNTFLSFSVEK